MSKLINKNIIQYIKHGYVLYGQKGLDLNQFKNQYSNVNNIRHQYNNLYGRDLPKEYVQRQFDNFLKENFVKVNDSLYYKKGSPQAKDYLFKSRLKQDPTYKDYWRDPETGQLYKKVTNTTYTNNIIGGIPQPSTTVDYVKVSKDIMTPEGNVLLYANNSIGNSKNNDPDDLVADRSEIRGEAGLHDYDPDDVYYYNVDLGNGKHRWAGRYKNPSKDKKAGWYWIKPGSTGYNSSGIQRRLNENNEWTDVTGDDILAQLEQEAGVSQNNSGNESGENSGNDSKKDEGSIISEFQPLKTDARNFKPSVPGRRASGEYRLVRRPTTPPVARPANMPLMNRADVRYTITDVTKGSPYGSSDVELVNSLANTSDKNVFKQALMNRLGMDKWDNSTALNRLNYLGIKGHIGGSDRKRLRNLINKGTTINGKIRN